MPPLISVISASERAMASACATFPFPALPAPWAVMRRHGAFEPPLLDGQLEEHRPHLREKGVRLLNRVAVASLGHRPDGTPLC